MPINQYFGLLVYETKNRPYEMNEEKGICQWGVSRFGKYEDIEFAICVFIAAFYTQQRSNALEG